MNKLSVSLSDIILEINIDHEHLNSPYFLTHDFNFLNFTFHIFFNVMDSDGVMSKNHRHYCNTCLRWNLEPFLFGYICTLVLFGYIFMNYEDENDEELREKWISTLVELNLGKKEKWRLNKCLSFNVTKIKLIEI